MKRYLQMLAVIVTGMFLFLSCTKTETVDYEKRAQNRMLEYKITNISQATSGAIDQVNNTITVYVPYYVGIEHLVADIKLDEDAVLLDSTGNEINLDGGLDPIAIGGGPVKYTVKSSDGASRNYTVKIVILPHPSGLVAKYSELAENAASMEVAVAGVFSVLGNFESTSTNAKFFLKEKATGKVYDNFLKVTAVEPGNANYSMKVNVLQEALAGDYEVTMEHQGRTAQLKPIHLTYNQPTMGLFSSTSAFAPGDTITFTAMAYSEPPFSWNGVFLELDRMYLRFKKQHVTTPAGFPENLFDQKIEMKIVEATRGMVKAVFPDVPAGVYYNSYFRSTDGGKLTITDTGFGFYFDFKAATGWGKDNLLATSASMFTVKAK